MEAVVTVCSKNPPGGRCRLYIAYAESLAALLGMTARVAYDPEEMAAEPPALLVGGHPIAPEDAFILTPEDIVAGLGALGLAFDAEAALARLRAVESKLMEG